MSRVAKMVLIGFLLGSVSAFAGLPIVSYEEALKHLEKYSDPFYPADAAQARIQGRVVMRLEIDESGKAKLQYILSGHPMLVPAARMTVGSYRFRPFEVEGHPVAVSAFFMVKFGEAAITAADRAEMSAQYVHATSLAQASEAMSQKKFEEAEQILKRAQLEIESDTLNQHAYELADILAMLGDAALAQGHVQEAETIYLKGASIDVPNREYQATAEAYAGLSNVYMQEHKDVLARKNALMALRIMRKHYKNSKTPESKRIEATAIGQQTLNLVRLKEDATKYCRSVADFEKDLEPELKASLNEACKGT